MGICMSALGLPTVEYPGAEVAEGIQDVVAQLPAEIANTKAQVMSDYNEAKNKDEDFQVLGGKEGETVLQVIKKDLEEDALKKEVDAAVSVILAKGKFAEIAAAKVWEKVEAKVDEKRPPLQDNFLFTADAMWAKAKEPIQSKVEEEVASKLEAAIDEAIKKEQASA